VWRALAKPVDPARFVAALAATGRFGLSMVVDR
jgi:hypothetical protein